MAETRARFLANTIGATSASNDFTLPDGVGSENQVISSNGAGGTTWANTLSAPTISSVTGTLNEYEDGVSEDGGVLTINGTDFGPDSSALSVQISGTTGFAVIAETSTISISTPGSVITATFTGAETNYNHSSFAAGSTIYIKVTKSGLQTSTYATLGTAMTGDPAFSTTSTTASTHTGTLAATSLGNYGGQITGGGQDSNTKLLLNFDRTGGTDIEDSSNSGGDGHKITASGNAVIKASPFGDGKSAMFFDGSDDILSIADHADFDFSGTWTIEFWMYASTIATGDGILTFDGSSSADVSIGFDSSSVLHFYSSAGSGTSQGNWGTLSTGIWYHIVAVHDGTNLKCYKDGQLVTSTVYNGTWSTTSGGLKIGRFYNADDEKYFDGYLDEIRIVNGSAVYTGNFDVPTSRLTAITNTKLLIHSNQSDDASSHKRPVTATGASQSNDSVAKTNRGSTSHTNWNSSAWYSSGVTNVLDIPFTEIGTGNFTIDFWVYPQTPPGSDNDQVLIDTRIGGGNGWFISWHKTSNQWRFYSYDGTTTDNHTFGTVASAVDGWDHVALQRSSGTMRLWVNGTQASDTLSSSSSLKVGNDGTIKIFGVSGNNNAHNWKGYLDELRISSVARYSSTTSITVPTGAYTSDDDTLLLLHGDGASFTDSSTSNHTITRTGSYHSQGHKGIAPALAWPQSLMKTGSAGVYFDGSGDILNLNISQDNDYDTAFTTGVWSLDTWCYMSSYPADIKAMCILAGTDNSQHGYNIGYYNGTQGSQGYWGFVGPGTSFTPSSDAADTAPLNTWFHILMVCNWSGDNMTLKVYKDGKYLGQQTSSGNAQALSNYTDHTHVCIGGDAYNNIGSGSGDKHNWHGYLTNWRFSGNDVTADSSDPLYTNSQTSTSSNNFVSGLPTQIYGAFRSQDVGTIQLAATAGTGGGALDYAELSGGTALSTYGLSLSSSGAITGTLTGIADNSNSGNVIRIRARANADDNRVTTLGGSSFTGITQNDNKVPTLFNARRYMGNATARDINGLGFQPDLVWFKERDTTNWHQLIDSVRGGNAVIYSNAHNTTSSRGANAGFITNFNSDGFSLDPDTSSNGINTNNQPFISWAFKAGGAPSGNFPASITNGIGNGTFDSNSLGYGNIGGNITATSVVQSVNQNSGFSITKYTSTGVAEATLPHNLGSIPDFIIVKSTSANGQWVVWHKDIGNGAGNYLQLNESDQKGYWEGSANSSFNPWPTAPTSSVLTLGNTGAVTGANTFICYAWKAVSGVSAFGDFTIASGNTGYTLTGLGFKPKLVVIKKVDTAGDWNVFDSFRSSADPAPDYLNWNASGTENTYSGVTCSFDNDGFELGSYYNDGGLSGGQQYIYMAFK